MADKKETNPLLIVFAVVAIGFGVFRLGGAFMDGYNEGTARETNNIIEQGGFEMSAEFILDDPEMSINVRTTVPQSMMMAGLSAGPEQDKILNYMLDEAGKIIVACDDVPDAEAKACISALDFTVPPYRP